MTAKHDTREPRGSRSLLSRHDRIYLLSLLLPFFVYDLMFKSLLVFSAPQDSEISDALSLMQIRLAAPKPPGLVEVLGLMQSNLLFHLGYVMLWRLLFALARTPLVRWIVVGVLHVLTLCVALITTIAYHYYNVTGSTLNYGTLFLGLSSFAELRSLITSEVSIRSAVMVFVMLIYLSLGPLAVTSFVERWDGRRATTHLGVDGSWRHRSRVLGLGLAAFVLFLLSLLPGVGPPGVSKAFARDAFVHVMMTAIAEEQGEELPEVVADPRLEGLPAEARLLPTGATKRRNVVLIALESTRADTTTPYNKDLPTTPFMDKLAKSSLLVERAYATMPHTHSALMAISCGIEPPLGVEGPAMLTMPDRIPDVCLPHLLRAQSYKTAFFMSQTKGFENSEQILENLGYQDFFSVERMDTTGFERTNYFGYEDEVMLAPSRAWLEKQRDEPFLAMYLTSSPHHDYLAPSKRNGRVAFTKNDRINRYLNSVRNQDFFLKQLFDQYRQLGLYDDTVFIIIGDHGQNFGEHSRNGHGDSLYEEGVRVPLLIHDPQRFQGGKLEASPVNQLDILPTVVDLLGYEIRGGRYSGSSLLGPLRPDRTLMYSCSREIACMASLKGTEKYVDYFDDRPVELFNLATDPGELNNLAEAWPPDELKRRRAELVAWRAKVRAMYDTPPPE